jgi:DNA-binding NtrC family response regulator
MKDNDISQAGKPASATLQCPAKPPHRILVVEDDRDIRRLNTEALINSGYHVDAAEDGAAAWNTLQYNGYDLLVTDNDMPKITGVDLLKKLHAAHLALPVILATGMLPRDEFARHPWIQPVAVLIKPYTIDELLVTVRKVLSEAEGTGKQIAPPPTWQNQAMSDDWELL